MTFFVGGAILGAGVIGAGAAIYGSTKQTQAQQAAINEQYGTQQKALDQILKLEQPFVDYSTSLQPTIGTESSTLNKLLTPGPDQTQTLSQLPGFQFEQNLAKWGIQAGAGNRGFSGSTAIAGGTAAGDIASTYFANLISGLQGKYASDIGLYGTGATAAGNAGSQTSSVTTGTGSNIASLLTGQGTTTAAGITGAAGSLGSSLTLSGLLGAIKNQNQGENQDNYNLVRNTPY